MLECRLVETYARIFCNFEILESVVFICYMQSNRVLDEE